MSSSQPESVRKFKGATVFDWGTETVSERPSEFPPTSQYSTQNSGPSTLEVRRARQSRRKSSNKGLRTLWASLMLVTLVAGAGLWGLTHWLHR